MHLICLDELNLAKIENYASDVLSPLEYSRKNRDDRLILYSQDIWKNLDEECKYLHGKEDFKSQQRLKIIQNLFKNYPEHKFAIPRNLVLLGTLNSDETTYDLSPKLIDPSFIITYPPADLTVNFTKQSNSDSQSNQSISTQSIVDKIDSYQDTIFEEQEKQEKPNILSNWNIIVEWKRI